jgi:hypothetical protein
MTTPFDRFLRHSRVIPARESLGRVFSVTRQSWRLTDDPRETRPETEVLATRRTASEAADLAREAALAFGRNGFHKPSGAWWGADGERFHRFVIRAGRRGTQAAVALGVGVAGLTALAFLRRRKGPPRA